MAEKKLTPTPAAQWVKTAVVELPSGNVVEVRGIDYGLIFMLGYIPNPLLEEARKVFSGVEFGSVEAKAGEMNPMEAIRKIYEAVALHMIVNPRVTDDGADGTLCIHDVELSDLEWLMQQVNLPVHLLRSFRQEQGAGVVAVQAGAEPVPSAERGDGARGVGADRSADGG